MKIYCHITKLISAIPKHELSLNGCNWMKLLITVSTYEFIERYLQTECTLRNYSECIFCRLSWFDRLVCGLFSGLLGWAWRLSTYLSRTNVNIEDQISWCAQDNQRTCLGEVRVSVFLLQCTCLFYIDLVLRQRQWHFENLLTLVFDFICNWYWNTLNLPSISDVYDVIIVDIVNCWKMPPRMH